MALVATITSAGFVKPTFEEVLSGLQGLFQGIYGTDIYIDPDSQDGQFIGLIANALNDCNQMAQDTYNSYSPQSAQGVGLANMVKINGIQPQAASYSTIPGNVIGQVGSIITAGVVKDENGNLWNLETPIVIPPAGEIEVTATAQSAGAIAIPMSGTFSIFNPQLGWQSFVPTAASTPGAAVESDADIRTRQTTSTAQPAQTILSSLEGTILNLAGVQRCKIYENDTDLTDTNGLPEHSIALVAQGGTISDITSAMALKKTPGGYTYGTTSADVPDRYGLINTMRYFILTEVEITVNISIKALANYLVTTGQLVQQTLAYYLSNLGIGDNVEISRLWAPANLQGQEAQDVSGQTQDQLNALSATFTVLSISISRTSNPVAALVTGGPYAAGVSIVTVNDITDLYPTQTVTIGTTSGNFTATITAVNTSTNQVTFSPAIPVGNTVPTGAQIYLISDVKIAFNEAASCNAATDVNLTVI